MIQKYDIRALIFQRVSQKSYHIASEEHVRIQFMNMESGVQLGPLVYDGDVIVTCYAGKFSLHQGVEEVDMDELYQAVIAKGQKFSVHCHSEKGTIQLIWTPPRAKVAQETQQVV